MQAARIPCRSCHFPLSRPGRVCDGGAATRRAAPKRFTERLDVTLWLLQHIVQYDATRAALVVYAVRPFFSLFSLASAPLSLRSRWTADCCTLQTVSTPEYSLDTGGSMKLAWPRTMMADDAMSQKMRLTGDAIQSIGIPRGRDRRLVSTRARNDRDSFHYSPMQNRPV